MNKKYIKLRIIIWSIIALLLLGVLVNFIIGRSVNTGFFMGENCIINGFKKVVYTTKEHKENIENIDKIKVNLHSSDIIINKSNDDKIKIVEKYNKESQEKEPLKIEKKGNELEIYSEQALKNKIFLKNINMKRITEIYLPQNLKSDLEIKSSVGDLKISTNLIVPNLKLDINVGDIEINEIKSEYYDIVSSVGDVEIQSLSGEGNVKSSVGDIECGLKSPKGTVNIEGDTGDVDVYLLDNTSFKLDAKCSVGEFDNNLELENSDFKGKNKHMKMTVGKLPIYNLNIKSNVGDINLNK